MRATIPDGAGEISRRTRAGGRGCAPALAIRRYARATSMPWRQATIRGQRVLARVKEDGSLDARGGRVEIRYKPTDARAYRAAPGNLAIDAAAAILPDDTCPPADEPATRSGAKGRGGAPAHGTRPEPVPHGTWIAYTDGACTGNPGPAGSGFIVVTPDGRIAEGWDYLGQATNNVAELTAILHALGLVPGHEPVVIHTDSQYAIGVLSKGWKAKANVDLIADIKRALQGRTGVRFVYVRGHAGVPLNERADELARSAIETRRSHKAELPPPEPAEELAD